MLENSIWNRYHDTKTIHEVLSGLLKTQEEYLSSDEGELYAALKRILTKKELRIFVMNEAGIETAEIASELNIDKESFDKACKKTYSKIKGNKMAHLFKTAHQNENN